MSIEDLKAGITLQINRYGYTEINADQLDALSSFWLEERGWSLAHKAGTSTYVVYKPRQARHGNEELGWNFDVPGATTPRDGLEAMRWAILQTPFIRDSMASRVLDEAARRVDVPDRPPRSDRYGTFQDIPFRVDDSLRPDEVWMVGQDVAARVENLEQPANQTATGALMQAQMEEASRRLNQAMWGNSFGATSLLTHDSRELPGRPDHYRVRPGLCACGFTSYFERDMDLHIADEIVDSPNGVPGRLRRCESCGISRWCREVVVAEPWSPSYYRNTPDAPLPPNGPAFSRVYRCDNCTRGL